MRSIIMAIVHSYVDLFRKWWEGVLFASNFIVMLPMIPSLFSQPMAHTQGIKSRCQGMTSMKGLTEFGLHLRLDWHRYRPVWLFFGDFQVILSHVSDSYAVRGPTGF